MFYFLSSIHWFVRSAYACAAWLGRPIHLDVALCATSRLFPYIVYSQLLHSRSVHLIISCHHKSVPLLCSHALPCGRPTVYRLPTTDTSYNWKSITNNLLFFPPHKLYYVAHSCSNSVLSQVHSSANNSFTFLFCQLAGASYFRGEREVIYKSILTYEILKPLSKQQPILKIDHATSHQQS